MISLDAKIHPTIARITSHSFDVTVPTDGEAELTIGGLTSPATTVVVTASGTFPSTLHDERLTDSSGTLYATLHVRDSSGTIVRQDTGSVELPARSEIKRKDFGCVVHLHLPSDRSRSDWQNSMSRAADMGCTWVRAAMPWIVMHPESTGFDSAQLTRTHNFLTDAQTYGLKVYAPLGYLYAPGYATDSVIGTNPDGVDYGFPRYDDLEEWFQICWDEFGDAISATSAQNEPNHSSSEATNSEYVGVWNDGMTARDAVGAKWEMCFGSLAFGDGPYLQQAYDNGLTGFDIVDIHPYNLFFDDPSFPNGVYRDPKIPWTVNNGSVEREVGCNGGVTTVREVMDANGDFYKPIWLWEFGFASTQREIDGRRLTELRAGAWNAQEMEDMCRWPDVKVIAPYILDYQHNDDPSSWIGSLGHWNPDGSRRRRLDAVETVIATNS